MRADIALSTKPQNASIIVDGKSITNCVGALRVQRMDGAVDLVASAGTSPTLTLELNLKDIDVTIDGDLVVNSIPVSESVGQAIYESLKERYEKEA